jgi:hypothetical protein
MSKKQNRFFGYALSSSQGLLSGVLKRFNAEEKKKWDTALDLDKGGRDDLKGHDIHYYLDGLVKLEQNHSWLKRDDAWFAEGKQIWCHKSVLLVSC